MKRELKKERYMKIIELIKEYEIDTQDEIMQKLSEAGFKVTQATVSRDIQNLHLIKSKVNGIYRYVMLDEINEEQEKFIRVLKDSFSSINIAENIVVYKTISGMAMAAAKAIDELHFEELVGSIAGDDSIFLLCKTKETALLLFSKIELLIEKS